MNTCGSRVSEAVAKPYTTEFPKTLKIFSNN